MERLGDNESGKVKRGLKIDVVRHGPSTYRQPEWSDIGTANDLNALGRYQDDTKSDEEIRDGKEQAVAAVKASAEKIAASISPDEDVVIWSSPTGRTLETARIISETLTEKGIKLRKKGDESSHGIEVFEHIGEVENFSWDLFSPLMSGGEVEFGGRKFFVDKALSNPRNLGYPEYFTTDAIKDIPDEVKAQWPEEYVAQIERFESFADVTERMANTLRRLKKVGDKNYRIVLVTHDALMGALVKTFTFGEFAGVSPAQFLSLERRGDKLVVTRVGDITEGDSERDVT